MSCQKFAPILHYKKKRCTWHELVEPDTRWSVNKLARCVTEWTQTGDKRLARLTSFLRFDDTGDCRTNLSRQLGLFEDSDFAGDLVDSKSTSGGVLLHFWKANICTDQLDVQEANVSISQLHRIRNHIAGCWFAYGWFICARLMGFGH